MAPQTSRPLPYTANPLLLMANDLILFLQITITWPITVGLPSIISPMWPAKAGSLDELSFSGPNIWRIFQHLILFFFQVGFIFSLIPFALVGLPLFYILYVVGFIVGNRWISGLINGPRRTELAHSHPDCVQDWPKHDNEKWVFINGVAVGNHWLQSNLDLIAMTFRRPVVGIHNQTRGILFDVLECIIQRDLSFPTEDIRLSYDALFKILSDDTIDKVVLFLHSQGGIEGGLVLDWLYDTVPAEQLRKLEIYTFGNAANHWNAPIVSSLKSNGTDPKSITNSDCVNGNGSTNQRVIQHIEHYANEGDYVSKFGILHFRPDQARPQTAVTSESILSSTQSGSFGSARLIKNKATAYPGPPPKLNTDISRSQTWAPSPKTPIEQVDGLRGTQEDNMFFGRLFKRASPGHMLNQHYLNYMFEMQGIDLKHRWKGVVKDSNRFMDTEIDMDVFKAWDTVQATGEGRPQGSPTSVRNVVKKQVKQLSRLWAYRNGNSPED